MSKSALEIIDEQRAFTAAWSGEKDDPEYLAVMKDYDKQIATIYREINIAIRTKNGKGYSKAAKEALGLPISPDEVRIEKEVKKRCEAILTELQAIKIARALQDTRLANKLNYIAALANRPTHEKNCKEIIEVALQTIKDYL